MLASLLVGLGVGPLVSAADPDNTIYVVGKYASGHGAIRAYDLSDSNATHNDGRAILATAATNGFVGVLSDPQQLPSSHARAAEASPMLCKAVTCGCGTTFALHCRDNDPKH